MSAPRNPTHPGLPAPLVWHPTYRAMAFFYLFGRAVERAGEALRLDESPCVIGACETTHDERWTLITSAAYGRNSAVIAAGWAQGLVQCARAERQNGRNT